MPAESARSAGEISKALKQLEVPLRVRLLGRASFWPHRLVRSSAESTTEEISLAFGHAMEIRLSRRLRSGVPPFTPYKVCSLLMMVGVFIVLLPRNCNINNPLMINVKAQLMERDAIYVQSLLHL